MVNNNRIHPELTREELLAQVQELIQELRADLHVSAKAAAEAKALAEETKASVTELLEVFVTIKGGVKFFTATVTILRWLVSAGLAVGAVIAAVQMFRSGVISLKFPS